ncbi:hypothetical protein HAX54_020042 [Datura stramonium]|uniref:DNA-directed RNA polymerase n=1 Tax=Datura stramonium TaxID=4076 RepID=A0ABS8Y3V9_DATST|nr:hypothetical protein [Datura stramonium]
MGLFCSRSFTRSIRIGSWFVAKCGSGTICGAIRHKLIPTPQNLVALLSWIRDIHPSHYGRICPIDTSEGINVGLIGSLAIHARIGHWGSLESPFYEISERSTGVLMLYLSPEMNTSYGSGRKFLSLKSGYSGRTGCSSSIPSRILDYCMEQFLFSPEKCIVGTGLERQAALDSGLLP